MALVTLANTLPLLVVGALSVVAAWRYTGGDKPYGYRGLGEVYVFVFFGLVATLGTLYTQAHRVTVAGFLGACGVGLLATAILVANNLRDIPTDAVTGKRTLAVRLGDRTTRRLYAACVALAFALAAGAAVVTPWTLLALGALPLGAREMRRVLGGASGRDLIPALAGTGATQLAYAVLLTTGLALAG